MNNIAIPDMLSGLDPLIIFPFTGGVARRVASSPMLVLHEAFAVLIATTSRMDAAFAINRTCSVVDAFRDHTTLPDMLIPFVDPCIVLPVVIMAACRIASSPMLILPEALAALPSTTFGGQAILAIVRACKRSLRQHSAVPDMLLPFVDPHVVLPLVIGIASVIASCPMLIFLEARLSFIRATLGKETILTVRRA